MVRTVSEFSQVTRDPITASVDERRQITRAYRAVIGPEAKVRLIGPGGEELPFPRPLQALLLQGMEAFLNGGAVVAVRLDEELTSNEAARFLNVSRPYLYRLLDEGKIPHTMIGSHRRIKFVDLLAFRQQRDTECAAALADLTRLSQEAGLYETDG